MIRVLVSNENCIDACGARTAQRFEAPHDFFAAESRVNQESRVLAFEQRAVARAAGGQDGDPKGNTRFLRATRKILSRSKPQVKGKTLLLPDPQGAGD